MAYVLAVVISLLWVCALILWALNDDGIIGFDFKGTLWNAAIAIREGRSPYPRPVLSEVEVGNPALYPPLLMFVVLPFTFLPWWIGLATWTVLSAVAIAAALAVLNVRDLRCYLIALVAQFTVIGLIFGNATLLLIPLVALAWRWRDRWVRVGIVLGLAIASKLFLWPLVLWLLGTRRYRAAGATVVASLIAVLVPWAAIGFDGFTSYPDLLRTAEEAYAIQGYSIAAMASALGAGLAPATKVALAVGLALGGAAFIAGRRGSDHVAATLAMLAAILGSPIVWPYYYTLLLIPVAMARPRFSGLWVALTLFYITIWMPRNLLTAEELEAGSGCCGPEGVPLSIWSFNHSPPAFWPAFAFAAVGIAVVALAIWTSRGRRGDGRLERA